MGNQDRSVEVHTYLDPGTGLVRLSLGDGLFAGQTGFDNPLLLAKGSPWFDVKAYGATGDGVTDDTTAINAAIAAIPVTGGTLFFPAGWYKFITGLAFSKSVKVVGAGRDLGNATGATRLMFSPAGADTAITVTAHACSFEGFDLYQGNATAAVDGITISGRFSMMLRQINIRNFTRTGLSILATASASCIYNNAQDIYVAGCDVGLLIQGKIANSKAANANTFTGCQFVTNTTCNVKLIDTANENSFYGCDVTGSAATMVQIGDGTNTCRSTLFWAVTAEGNAANIAFDLQANSIGTIIHGDVTSVATKVNGTTAAWFYDNALGTMTTFGNTGVRISGANGSIGLGNAAPQGDGINFPAGSGIYGAGAFVAYVNSASFQLNRLLLTLASATGVSGFRLPHGAAPTSPVDGDMWSTTAGLFIRVNGVTKTVTLT